MARSRNPIIPAHSSRITKRARQIKNNRVRNALNFRDVTNWANNTLGTTYSIYQVSACLGNAGFRQTAK